MTKAESIGGVIASAIDEFSRLGYAGASLRDIATSAGVPLSAIHRYFGNKQSLYAYVHRRVGRDKPRTRRPPEGGAF